MAVEIPKERWSGRVREATSGAAREDGCPDNNKLYGDGKHVFRWALQGEKAKWKRNRRRKVAWVQESQ